MPDIVITPNRGTVNNPKIDFTGTSAGTIKLEVLADGTIAWNGANGSLFSIADSLSGSLMSVNDISGLPAFEVFSDNRVVVGQFGANLLLGKTTNSSNGRLQLASSATSAGGIGFGTDTDLYRGAAGRLVVNSSSGGGIDYAIAGTVYGRSYVTGGGTIQIGSIVSANVALLTNSITALTLDTSQNATFVSNVNLSGAAKPTILINSIDAATNGGAIAFASNTAYKWIIKHAAHVDGNLFTIGTATGVFTSNPVLSLNHGSSAATFAGAVTVAMTSPEVAIRSASDGAGQNQFLTFGSTTYNRAQFKGVSAGTNDGSLELRTFNAGTQTLSQTWNKDGSSTFAGTVTASGAVINYPYGDAYPFILHGTSFLKANANYYGMLIKSGDVNYISGKIVIIGGANKRLEIGGYEEAVGAINTVIPYGNFGIGVVAPSQKLEVNGNILAGNSVANNSISVTRTGANSSSLAIQAFTDSPAITWNGAGGYLRFIYSSTEQMRIDSAGNVGIGTQTASPYKLSVDQGAVVNYPINLVSSGKFVRIGALNASYAHVDTDAASGFYFYDQVETGSGNSRLGLSSQSTYFAASGGNVGIATTNPLTPFHVRAFETVTGNEQTQSGLRIDDDLGSSGTVLLAGVNKTALYTYIQSMQPNTSFTSRPLMLQLNGGNVSVGTTVVPSDKLEVAGAIAATGPSTGLAAQPHATIIGVSGGTSYLQAVDWGSEYKALIIDAQTISLQTGTGSTSSRFYINNVGNIGIATTSPAAKLDVAGDARISGNLLAHKVANYTTSYPGINSFGAGAIDSASATYYDTGKNLPNINFRGVVWTGKHYIFTDYLNNRAYFYDNNFDSINNAYGVSFVTLPMPAGGYVNPHGAAWDGRYLWVCVYLNVSNGKIVGYDIDTSGNATIIAESAPLAAAVTYDIEYADGHLYVIKAGALYIYKWNGSTIDQVATKANVAGAIDTQAITYDGSYLWCTGNGASIYKLKLDGTQVAVISSGFPPDTCGWAWNGSNIVSFDYDSLDIYIIYTSQYRIDTENLSVMGGNVGIGTTSPASKLHISGTSGTSITINDNTSYTNTITNANAVMTYTVDTGNAAAGSASHIFKRYTTEFLRINQNGNVGIGITTPEALLHAANLTLNNAAFQHIEYLTANNSNETGGEAFNASLSSFGLGFRRQWNSTQHTNLAGIYAFGSSGWRGGLVLRTKNNTTSTGEPDINAIVISPAGNVGVGTTSPGGKLEINHTAATGATALIMRCSDSTSGNAAIRWQNNGGTNQAGIGSVFNVSDPGAIEFLNGATTNMVLRSTGNVGIGTTSPSSKLEVNGVVKDQYGDLRTLPENAKSAAYILAASDTGRLINITTGGITVNSAIFSVGQAVTIYNNSAANQTITQGTSVTMYLAGSATTGNRTLAQRGLASVICVAANTFVISGSGLT